MLFFYAATVSFTERDFALGKGEGHSLGDDIVPSKNEDDDDDDDDDWESLLVAVTSLVVVVYIHTVHTYIHIYVHIYVHTYSTYLRRTYI